MAEVGPIYSDYIDTLPYDRTMGFVFADLYLKGDTLAQSLVPQAPGSQPALHIDSSRTIMEENIDEEPEELPAPEDEVARYGRTIIIGTHPAARYLFRIAEEGRVGDEHAPGVANTPVSISGYRNNQTWHGSYYLDSLDGEIVCTIDRVVAVTPEEELFGHPFAHENPYSGDTRYPLDTKVTELSEDEREKLRIITNGIRVGIGRAAMLREGADFYEMFDITRPAEPEKPSLLRRILGK